MIDNSSKFCFVQQDQTFLHDKLVQNQLFSKKETQHRTRMVAARTHKSHVYIDVSQVEHSAGKIPTHAI